MPKWEIWLLLAVAAVLALVIQALGPRAGKAPSEPEEPTSSAPIILGVDFSKEIPADGNKFLGTVRFRDTDGDIVLAKFEVVQARLFSPFEFDPGVSG